MSVENFCGNWDEIAPKIAISALCVKLIPVERTAKGGVPYSVETTEAEQTPYSSFTEEIRNCKKKMGFKDFVCSRAGACVGAILVVIILIIGLVVGLTVKKYQAEKNLKYATEKYELPTHYLARRPKGINIYNDMVYLSPNGKDEIGHARKCVSCLKQWTVYMLNEKEEIAVVIKKKSWTFTAKYDIEEQWKTNSTSYHIQYSWSGSGITKVVYIIKNSNDVEVARTNSFRFEFDKTITLKDSKGTTLGVINRPAFQLYPTWDIKVNNKDVVPTYLFGALATITTIKEAEDNDKK